MEIERAAATQYMDIAYDAIGKELNLTEEEVDRLFMEEPQKYIDTLEKLMAEGKLEMSTNHTLNADQIALRGAQHFGISTDKYEELPPAIRNRFEDQLKESGAMEYKVPNPHLREQFEKHVQQTKENIESLKNEPPEEAPAEKPDPSVSFDKEGNLRIAGLRPSEYFAQHANPAPTPEAPAPQATAPNSAPAVV